MGLSFIDFLEEMNLEYRSFREVSELELNSTSINYALGIMSAIDK